MIDFPKVGIILLNWNGEEDTVNCLSSLKYIDYPNYEIVLVDNGSQDGSPDRIKAKFPEITLIKNKENLGFAEGNNVGIRRLLQDKTDYFLLLNNDTVVDKNFLREMVSAFDRDPKIGMAGPKIYYMHDRDRIWYAGGDFRKISGRTYHIGQMQKDKGQFDEFKEVGFITGCALLVKREVVDKIGLLDKDYFNNYEDVDWSARAKAAGYKLMYVPTSVIWHKFAASMGGRFSPFYIYYRIRNNLLYVKKNNGSTVELLFHLILSPVKMFGFCILTLNFKGIISTFYGLLDFIIGRYGKGRDFSRGKKK